jgi:BirA family biotin operon repressor/biotin-[acetyl-CoA-carboxylase] ligase
MVAVSVRSPFDAPVYHVETVGSTMDAAKELAARGEPDGTVIVADYQETGRGRFPERRWVSGAGESLLFTVFFRYGDFSEIPPALTLRVGLAVSSAADRFIAPQKTAIKWPNDILVGQKKLSGILVEGIANTVYIGIGVNVSQPQFAGNGDADIARAVSIMTAKNGASKLLVSANSEGGKQTRFLLLEEILAELDNELHQESHMAAWRQRLEERLFMRGKEVNFAPGGRGTEDMVRGCIIGIGGGGELVLQTASGEKKFISGEIRL